MRSHYGRGNARPSRTEINAVRKAYDILYAPLPKKEKTMPKSDKENDNGKAIATQTPTHVAAPAEMGLAVSTEVIQELETAERELAIAMNKHTSAREILKRDEPFFIVDAVFTTMEEEVKHSENGRTFTTTEERPKVVWVLQMQAGDTLTCMQSFGNIRGKWYNYFQNAYLKGVRVEAGPMKFVEVKTRTPQPEPAVVFQPQPNFKFKKAVAAESTT